MGFLTSFVYLHVYLGERRTVDRKVRLYALWVLLVLIFLKPAWHLVEYLQSEKVPSASVQSEGSNSLSLPAVHEQGAPGSEKRIEFGSDKRIESGSDPKNSDDTLADVRKVNVMVSSNPPGARVWVDGKDSGGVTDAMLWGIVPGVHTFEYLKDGYVPQSVKIVVPSGSFFEAPVVELVLIDARETSTSSASGSTVSNGASDLTSGGRQEKITGSSADSSQAMAELSFAIVPEDAQLVVFGKTVDTSKPLRVKAGLLTIKASAPGYSNLLLNQYLKPGEKKTLTLRLTKRESPESLVRLGQSFLSIQNYDKAAQYFFQAVELAPDDYLLHLKLIDALFRAERNNEALKAVKRGEAIFSDSDPFAYFHGLALFRINKPEEALPYLKKAAKNQWSDEGKVESLAVCYEALDEWENVLNTADRLCLIAPSGKAYNLRGYALFRLGKFTESTSAFEKALQYSPQSYEILLNAAGAAMASGNKEKGKEFLRKAMKVNPDAALARGILE